MEPLTIAANTNFWWFVVAYLCTREVIIVPIADVERIPWLAADAIGALFGMATYMISHAANNDGSLNGCCGDGIGVTMLGGCNPWVNRNCWQTW